MTVKIIIDGAEIVRINKNTNIRKYGYALKFTDVKKIEEKKIREFIYNCQRKALKRRGYMED